MYSRGPVSGMPPLSIIISEPRTRETWIAMSEYTRHDFTVAISPVNPYVGIRVRIRYKATFINKVVILEITRIALVERI